VNKVGSKPKLTRMARVARIYFSDDWRPFLLAGIVFGGLAFFSGFIMDRPAVEFFFNTSLLVGLVLISRLFAGIHSREKGMYLFLLPASVEEKFAIQWLASLIGFFLYATLVVFLGSTASSLLNSILYQSVELKLLYPRELSKAFQTYFFFHAIFFTGALFFKKNNFLKTTLVLMAVSFVVLVSSAIYLKNNLMQYGHSQINVQFNGIDEFFRFIGGPSTASLYYLRVILFIAVPLALYILSFYRFKNSEIKG